MTCGFPPVGVGVGEEVGVPVGDGVGFGVGVPVGRGVAVGEGVGEGVGESLGVGEGVGVGPPEPSSGGACGTRATPPPPTEAGPLLLTTSRCLRISMMSFAQGLPLTPEVVNEKPQALWNCATVDAPPASVTMLKTGRAVSLLTYAP
ncbi:MAG: hypothetical protein DLM65_07820 [Candidatus Aeolococcus gillhamiae]|uniref:Uncharacterized protein n=1 Tax=Candidatus Aeolococcus gillhamiae TaxID=3127015 RepID=A0A2W5Z5F7_9BACT|nr:MAG: hypothetical protein DLM65_07820 [Candidatus Dormibacter sp. RRmetagenome_bin12]